MSNATDEIYELRLRTGAGIQECSKAYKRFDGDILLAEGWLKYYGCAINTYDVPHEVWVEHRARGYKKQVQTDPSKRIPLILPDENQ